MGLFDGLSAPRDRGQDASRSTGSGPAMGAGSNDNYFDDNSTSSVTPYNPGLIQRIKDIPMKRANQRFTRTEAARQADYDSKGYKPGDLDFDESRASGADRASVEKRRSDEDTYRRTKARGEAMRQSDLDSAKSEEKVKQSDKLKRAKEQSEIDQKNRANKKRVTPPDAHY